MGTEQSVLCAWRDEGYSLRLHNSQQRGTCGWGFALKNLFMFAVNTPPDGGRDLTRQSIGINPDLHRGFGVFRLGNPRVIEIVNRF